jgi:DNA-directed RNA polymerase specialized sigma24 family protein
LRNDVLVRFLLSHLRKGIAAAIDGLPEQERLVITLYYYEEFSLAQIGFAIGEPHARVSQIYASGLANLRAQLQDPVVKRKSTTRTRPSTNGSESLIKAVPPPPDQE